MSLIFFALPFIPPALEEDSVSNFTTTTTTIFSVGGFSFAPPVQPTAVAASRGFGAPLAQATGGGTMFGVGNAVAKPALSFRNHMLSSMPPEKDTMRLEIVCATSSIFNVLAPRFANHPNGVCSKQLKIVSRCDTFQYANAVNFNVVSETRPPGAFGGLGSAPEQHLARIKPQDSTFLANLIRTKLHYIVSFKMNAAPQELIVAALLASERLESFQFASTQLGEGKDDFHLIELLRHRNHNVRRKVLHVFREHVASGNPNSIMVHPDPTKPRVLTSSFGLAREALYHPVEVCASRGYVNALAMLLELQDELVALRQEQKEIRAFEVEDFLKKKAEEAEQTRLRQLQFQRQQVSSSLASAFGSSTDQQVQQSNGGGFIASHQQQQGQNTNALANVTFGGGTAAGQQPPTQQAGLFGRPVPGAALQPQPQQTSLFSTNLAAAATVAQPPQQRPFGATFNAVPHIQQPAASLFATGAASPTEMLLNHPDPTLRPPLFNVKVIDLDLCLYLATQDGHTSCVEFLLSRGARTSGYSKNKQWFPIDVAAANGHVGVVKLLHRAYIRELKKWDDEHPNEKIEEEKKAKESTAAAATTTAMPLAVTLGGFNTTGTRMSEEEQQQKRLEPRKPFRGNALHKGAHHLSVVKYLLSSEDDADKYYNVNDAELRAPDHPPSIGPGLGGGFSPQNINPTLPLHHAIAMSSGECVSYFLKRGASVTSKGGVVGKASALTHACQRQNLEILHLLINKGKPSTKSLNDALVAAARNGSSAIVEYLLKEVKVDPNCIDSSSQARETPLVACCRKSCSTSIVRLLIEAGADVNKESQPNEQWLLSPDTYRPFQRPSARNVERTKSKLGEDDKIKNNNNNEDDNDDDEDDQNDEGPLFVNAEHNLKYLMERVRVAPLAALFIREGEQPPSSLYAVMKLLLFEGKANPNVYIPHAFLAEQIRANQVGTFGFMPSQGKQYNVSGMHRVVLPSSAQSLSSTAKKTSTGDEEGENDDADDEKSATPNSAPAGGTFGGGYGSPMFVPGVGLTATSQFIPRIVLVPICQILCNENPLAGTVHQFSSQGDYSCLELFLDAPTRLDASMRMKLRDGEIDRLGFPVVMDTALHRAASFVRDEKIFKRLVSEANGDIWARKQIVFPSWYGDEEQTKSIIFGQTSNSSTTSKNENGNTNIINNDDDDMQRASTSFTTSGSKVNTNNEDEFNELAPPLPARLLTTAFRECITCANWAVAISLLDFAMRTRALRLDNMEQEDMQLYQQPSFSWAAVVTSQGGFSTITNAASHKMFGFLRQLKEYGADPNIPDRRTGRTILNVCCSARAYSSAEAEHARAISRASGCTTLKIRTEQDEFDFAQKRSLRDEELVGVMQATHAQPAKRGELSEAYLATLDSFQRMRARVDRLRQVKSGGSAGFGSHSLVYAIECDTHPEPIDFYNRFLCQMCDTDMMLTRGLRRFCAGCFEVFCPKCIDETQEVVDVKDGAKKKANICLKCKDVLL